MGVNQITPDRFYHTFLVDKVILLNNELQDKRFPKFNMDEKLASGNFEIDFDKKYPSTFLEWSNGASEHDDIVNNNCIKGNPDFMSEYKEPTAVSHRSLSFEIGFNQEKLEGNLEDYMGNQIQVIDSKNKEAVDGLVPKGIITVSYTHLTLPTICSV